jgi:hypothetical protein
MWQQAITEHVDGHVDHCLRELGSSILSLNLLWDHQDFPVEFCHRLSSLFPRLEQLTTPLFFDDGFHACHQSFPNLRSMTIAEDPQNWQRRSQDTRSIGMELSSGLLIMREEIEQGLFPALRKLTLYGGRPQCSSRRRCNSTCEFDCSTVQPIKSKVHTSSRCSVETKVADIMMDKFCEERGIELRIIEVDRRRREQWVFRW